MDKNSMKAMEEKRAELAALMQALVDGANEEERAMSEEEKERFDAAEAEARAIDATIERMNKAREFMNGEKRATGKSMTTAEAEERAFNAYIFGEELRSGEQNLSMTNNGAIIPASIAQRIVKTVYEISPILQRATRYNVKGTLKVPVWGVANNTHNITVAYGTEFTDLIADSGKFTSVDLTGYLVGALALIGRSVENNAGLNVTDFIVNQIAEELARFLEGEALVGTNNKATGALSTTNSLNVAAATLTADNLIDLQSMVKTAFQRDACWIMNPTTFTAIKKLKDSNNRYLLQDDVSGDFPYRILGKPVFLSDNMPEIGAGNKSVLYGDCKGLSVNFREEINIQVLREKYATQHAIGVVSWAEFDSKVTDNSRLAVATHAAASVQ